MVHSLQESGIAIVIVCASLATVAVGLRLISRHLGRNWGKDDALAVIALVFALVYDVMSCVYAKKLYLGYHFKDIPLDTYSIPNWVSANRLNFARIFLYPPIIGCARGSVLVFLLRLDEYRKKIRMWLYFLLILNFLDVGVIMITDIFACRPIYYQWEYPAMNKFLPDGTFIAAGTCINVYAFGLSNIAITILLDVLTLMTPMVMVWRLRMLKTNKIITVLVLSVGWLATVCSVGNLIVYLNMFHAQPGSDGNYSVAWTLSIVESNVAVIACSVPALKALWKRVTSTGSTTDSRNATGSVEYPSVDRGPTGLDDIIGRRRPSRPTLRDSIYDEMYVLDHKRASPDLCNESQERIIISRGKMHDKSAIELDDFTTMSPSSAQSRDTIA